VPGQDGASNNRNDNYGASAEVAGNGSDTGNCSVGASTVMGATVVGRQSGGYGGGGGPGGLFGFGLGPGHDGGPGGGGQAGGPGGGPGVYSLFCISGPGGGSMATMLFG